ncbi:MAG: MOSC domain-containing protein [Chloroflexi bacterium]|nr:MOSC domain-containing protein [Chloroflexota bacterium]
MDVAGRVLSVNVGRPRPVERLGQLRSTAIRKRPVEGRVAVRGVNVDGDEQADRRSHGGPEQAVYAYAREDYAWFERELGQPLDAATFGENLTLEGIDVSGARVGERWKVGSAVLEVTRPRLPCWKLGDRMGDQRFVARFAEAERFGAYLRIVQEGELASGDEVQVDRSDAGELTVRDVGLAELRKKG